MIDYRMGPQPAPRRPLPIARSPEQEQSLRNVTLVVYLLYGVSMLTALPLLLAVVLNYARLDESRGSLYNTHLRWLLRTFWWGLFWSVLGICLMVTGLAAGSASVGPFDVSQGNRVFGIICWFTAAGVLFLDWLWILTRLVRGLLNWNDRLGMPG